MESSEIVWQTVRDRHPDPKLNGLDWQSIHDRTKPLIANARTMDEVREILRRMLSRLGSSHYAIIAGDLYGNIDAAAPPASDAAAQDGSPGFAAAVIDGKALVSAVEPGSPADRAGIRPGMVIEDIGGTNVDSLIRATGALDIAESDSIAERSITRHLQGAANSPVSVDLLDSAGHAKHVDLSRSASPGAFVRFANLPPMRLIFQSRLLDKAGYIRLNAFLEPATVMPKFEAVLRQFENAPGIILDLRGNPGGIGIMAMGIAGFFIEREGLKLGEMKMREMTIQFVVFPRAHPYRGKLAILVDAGSASTSEILAQGLQDLGRARIFGVRTAGAALPSDIIRLPNGDGFQFAQASYISIKGRVLESNGVVPDLEVHQTAAALESGRDLPLEAAEQWIAAR